MLDFTASLAPEMVLALTSDRQREARNRELVHRARQLEDGAQEPGNIHRFVRGRKKSAQRRRELFIEGLDAAQREGITIDAWFGYRFADPELSARAEWAGLVENGARNKKDAWAA